MRKLALALAATAALGMAAPSDAEAWGYRYGGWGQRHGGWGGVGAGLAIGALAGGLIAASTAPAYAYPSYSYSHPAGYGYGYGYGGHYGGYGVRRVAYYGGHGIRRGYGAGVGRVGRWR